MARNLTTKECEFKKCESPACRHFFGQHFCNEHNWYLREKAKRDEIEQIIEQERDVLDKL